MVIREKKTPVEEVTENGRFDNEAQPRAVMSIYEVRVDVQGFLAFASASFAPLGGRPESAATGGTFRDVAQSLRTEYEADAPMSEDKTKYTPGPWVVGQDELSVFARMRPLFMIADCASMDAIGLNQNLLKDVRAMQSANARLIAAAPQLYEALKALDESLELMARNTDNPSYIRIEAKRLHDQIRPALNAVEEAS